MMSTNQRPQAGKDITAPESGRSDVTDNQQGRQVNSPSSGSARRTRKSASAFRTISEVADELDVQQHVLRFWETKFSQVKPLKRGGGRRYYRPEDVALLKKIHHLLYTEGYTIKGVQKLLRGQGKQQILAEQTENGVTAANESTPAESPAVSSAAGHEEHTAAQPQPGLSDKQKAILTAMLGDLKELRDMLKGDRE